MGLLAMSCTDSNSSGVIDFSPGNEEESKPGSHLLTFKVQAQDGGELWFRMKASTSLRKAMKTWCEKQREKRATIVFVFRGRRVASFQTPFQLGMVNGDVLDAMQHVCGGGPCH